METERMSRETILPSPETSLSSASLRLSVAVSAVREEELIPHQ